MSALPRAQNPETVPEDGADDSRGSEAHLIRHGACGKAWTGRSNGHCGQCHETFTRGAFDRHQRISRGVITCSTAKLVQRAKPWGTLWTTSGGYWPSTPAADPADTADTAEAPRVLLGAPGGPSAPAAGPRLATGPTKRTHNWATSDRASRLPADWPDIRARIFERDNGRCQHPGNSGTGCLQPARDVDHRQRGDDHRDENLWCLCGPHHDAKTQAEAYAARVSLFRAPEAHPGLLPPTGSRA